MLHTFCTSLIKRLTVILGMVSPIAAMPPAIAQPKILIVNSDSTVEKYRQAKNEFQHEMSNHAGRILGIDLDQMERPDALSKLIGEERPDLIYSIGSKAYQFAEQSRNGKPLLFSSVINWQRFDRGKDSYGVANELSLSQELSLLRYLLPNAKRIGILYHPQYSRERVAEARAYAKEVGLTLTEKSVEDVDDVEEALDSILPTIDVLWLIADPGVLADRETIERIFTASEKQKKPIYTYSDAYLRYGASLVVAADTPTIGRQAATLAESILRHETISDSVQTPAGSHITLNICQLAKLKAHYNEDALDAVNQLLQCQ